MKPAHSSQQSAVFSECDDLCLVKPAYTLTQIVFGLAIIAVLMTMAIGGITILQRSSRDSSRRNTLADLVNILADYNRENLGYPNTESIVFTQNGVEIEGEVIYELPGALQAGTETSSSRTQYYYERTLQGFALCAELESNVIESVGTSECPDVSMW